MNDADEGVTRWRRVADRIRASIADGSVAEQLPPETELAERYAVNRHTVRRAIQSLAAEGLLRSERGRGTFVNAPAPRLAYPVGPRTRFSENVTAQGQRPAGRLIRSETVRADPALAAMLDCPIGAALARLDTLSVASGLPLSVSTGYFPADRFPNIVRDYAETGSITEALRRHGLPDYRRLETRITAERVHPSDAAHLDLPPDSIVLISSAIDVDAEDRPVQALRSRFPADRMELVIRL
ncbi:phosphonate metabolism transcriptional regulator PhnF [uncultured Aureimonas sp.]|uniref:phosphonate metabolism transcriptional regulator PhnF n=1 Tax=uncultured Aureimonas sp. TaxID=1604662 RepID=UPI0025DF525F|nr:phosphonate metabolism transcriptional regulator PhnF [uncultured Aureimonas sp.]